MAPNCRLLGQEYTPSIMATHIRYEQNHESRLQINIHRLTNCIKL